MGKRKTGMDEDLLSIGEAAAASGLSVRTIRYYEEIGLIPRPRRRNGTARTGGNRVYGAADVGHLRFIRRARMLGLGLDAIRDLLALAEKDCPSRQPEYRPMLNRHLRIIEQQVGHLLALRDTIQQLLSRGVTGYGDGDVWSSCGCLGMSDAGPGSGQYVARSREDGAEVERRATAGEPVEACCAGMGNRKGSPS